MTTAWGEGRSWSELLRKEEKIADGQLSWLYLLLEWEEGDSLE